MLNEPNLRINMSTTTSSSKGVAINSLKNSYWRFRVDLLAIPEEAIFQNFGGCSRTAADIVFEIGQVNDHIGQGVRNEVQFEWVDGWLKAPESWKTKQDVVDAFEKSADLTIKTFENFTQEELEVPYEDDGKTTTRIERCRFIAWHNDYHSGQLNFIQSLLGDDKFHWMG